MTDVSPARTIIQQEEVDSPAGVTATTFKRMAEVSNLNSMRQYDTKSFFLNGPYGLGVGDQGVDGLYVIPFNMELLGLSMFNLRAGASGTTTLDVHWLNSGGDQGSIFSTKPAIGFNAGNNAYLARNLVSGNDKTGTGLTLPVFSKTLFNEFDALRLDIDAAQSEGENAGLILWYRPR
jgi:hypothetical protein